MLARSEQAAGGRVRQPYPHCRPNPELVESFQVRWLRSWRSRWVVGEDGLYYPAGTTPAEMKGRGRSDDWRNHGRR